MKILDEAKLDEMLSSYFRIEFTEQAKQIMRYRHKNVVQYYIYMFVYIYIYPMYICIYIYTYRYV